VNINVGLFLSCHWLCWLHHVCVMKVFTYNNAICVLSPTFIFWWWRISFAHLLVRKLPINMIHMMLYIYLCPLLAIQADVISTADDLIVVKYNCMPIRSVDFCFYWILCSVMLHWLCSMAHGFRWLNSRCKCCERSSSTSWILHFHTMLPYLWLVWPGILS
jgi:hypothetical protein